MGLLAIPYPPFTPNTFSYETVVEVEGLNVPSSITNIFVSGYNSPNDGGAAYYIRVDSEPSVNGKFQDASGDWFQLVAEVVTPAMLGADQTGTLDSSDQVEKTLASYEDVLVPKGHNYRLTRSISVPSNRTITLNGTFSGTNYEFNCLGDINFFGPGILTGSSNNASQMIKVVQGSIQIKDIQCIGSNPAARFEAAVYVTPNVTGITSLSIQGCTIARVQYGILRNDISANATNTIQSMNISGNNIYDLTGDGIEMNYDAGTQSCVISNNNIKGINSTLPNQGIGIGLAGVPPYGPTIANPVSRFFISGNRVSGCAQGIHLELASNVSVQNNVLQDINIAYASGLAEGASIIVYGSNNCSVSNNVVTDSVSGDIKISLGVTSGSFVNSVNNIIVSGNISINASGIRTFVSREYTLAFTYPASIIIDGNKVLYGRISHAGVCDLTVSNNNVLHNVGTVGFDLNYNNGTLANNFYYVLSISNNRVRDKFGNSKVSIINLKDPSYNSNLRLMGGNNTFSLDSVDGTGAASGVLTTPTSNSFWYNGVTAGPVGINCNKGALYISKDNGKIYLCTASGTVVPASDTYTVIDGPNGVVQSSNLAWTSGTHTVGQFITLSDGSNTVNAIVGEVYISGSYRMQLFNPTNGSILNLGSLGSGTITATNTATFVTAD